MKRRQFVSTLGAVTIAGCSTGAPPATAILPEDHEFFLDSFATTATEFEGFVSRSYTVVLKIERLIPEDYSIRAVPTKGAEKQIPGEKLGISKNGYYVTFGVDRRDFLYRLDVVNEDGHRNEYGEAVVVGGNR